ncbi:MAG TPA: hypothetical protein VKG63_01485 [Steroidobacteraceae bacterium]|nr:hypothetical protein [Steroidobacteraceae bacterium]
MPTDGTIDFTKYTDDDLRRALESVDFSGYPKNGRNLAREFESRWRRSGGGQAPDAASIQSDSFYRFEDLPGGARSRFFWPYFLYSFGWGLLYSAALTAVSLFVEYVWLIAAGVTGAPRVDGATILLGANVGLSLISCVPLALLWIRWLTRRSFGGCALRISHASARDVV